MRITGGLGGGLPLFCPKGKGIRPATDQSREAVFSSLGPGVEPAAVLDLYAGTGAYGLEALSRGARSCLFVDNDRRACAAIEKNRDTLQRAFAAQERPFPPAQVRRSDILPFLNQDPSGPFDLIFVDPPYEDVSRLWVAVLGHLERRVSPRGRVLFETGSPPESIPRPWNLIRQFGKKKKNSPQILMLALHP